MNERSFKDIKVGDILLKKGRRLNSFQEWKEVTVDKVTKVFYHVAGESFDRRKEKEGKDFPSCVYFPEQNGAPKAATTEDFDQLLEYAKIINCVGNNHYTDLTHIKDMKLAYELAMELQEVLNKIKEAYNAQG